MKEGRLLADACKPVSEATYDAWTRRMRPEEGDLILAREAPVGQVIRVPREVRLCLGQRTVLLRPDAEKVEPRFLHYWLLGPDAQGMMNAQAAGATVPHLNVDDIRALDTSRLPDDRSVQAFAATTLGAIDDLIENNWRRVELLEQMAQAIYREWFVHFRFPGHEDATFVDSPLGPIPDAWEIVPLGAIAEEVRVSVKPSDETVALPYVPIDSIDAKSVTLRSFRPGSEAASSLRLFEAGDVLFGAMRAYFHKVCVAPFRGVTRSTCFVLRPARNHYHFATMTLAEPGTVAYAAAHSTGSTIPYAKWSGVLSEMRIRQPPTTLAGAFGEVVAPLLLDARRLVPQNHALESIRDLVLPKLVTGQIDVSELGLDALVEAVA